MNKNKFSSVFWSIVSPVAFLAAFIFVFLAGGANAASTIGTNLSTTGTFEASNTASAAYFLTSNTIQVGGGASVAYNRFGTSDTGHSGYMTTSNDVLINGDLEVRATASFGSVASVSGILYLANGQVRPGGGGDSTTAFRFQNTAGTATLTIDTSNGWVGIGTTPTTDFEVQGTASASYFLTTNSIQVGGGTASVTYSRFGSTGTTHAGSISAKDDVLINGDLEVDASAAFDGFVRMNNAASVALGFEVAGNALVNKLVVGSSTASSSGFTAEFTGTSTTATTSLYIGPIAGATNRGTCLEMKDTTGAVAYVRINGTAFVINSVSCK